MPPLQALILSLLLIQLSSQSHAELKAIDQLISSLQKRKQEIHETEQIHIEKKQLITINTSLPLKICESIKTSIKGVVSFNLFYDQEHIYGMDGDIMANITQDSHMSTLRNDHVILLTQDNTTLSIRSLAVKQKGVEWDNLTKIYNYTTRVISFMSIGGMRARRSFLVFGQNGTLSKYSSEGKLETHNNLTVDSVTQMLKIGSQLILVLDRRTLIFDAYKLAPNGCQFLPGKSILKVFSAVDQLIVVLQEEIQVYSISKCRMTRSMSVPRGSKVYQLGELIMVVVRGVAYSLNPENKYAMGTIPLRFPQESNIITAKRAEHSNYLVVQDLSSRKVSLYEYASKVDQDSGFDIKGFKIPMFLVSLGIIIFYSYKGRNNASEETKGGTREGRDSSDAQIEKEMLELLRKSKQS